jgi:hypothetical protein
MDAGWLALSLGMAGLGSPDGSAGVAGALVASAHVGGPAFVDLGVHQGGIAGPTRVVTGIHAGGRVLLTERAFLKGGFVHQHETDFVDWKDDLVLATLGASEAIHHRTGAELGLGWRFELPVGPAAPIRLSLSANALAFPDDGGPHLYGVVETLATFPLGRRSAEP